MASQTTTEYQFAGKVALVTGASTGIGFALAKAFLKRGVKVCMIDCNTEKGEKSCSELQEEFKREDVLFMTVDVTKRDQLATAFTKTKEVFGQLDIVCNNAGIVDPTDWRLMVEINLVAVIEGITQAVDHMSTQKGGNGGVIINTSSMAGLAGIGFFPHYCATKHGVAGYTRALEGLARTDGVRVNCFCPGLVNTPLLRSMPEGEYAFNDSIVYSKADFLKYSQSPDDVAEAVVTNLIKDNTKAGAVCCISYEKGAYFPKLFSVEDFGVGPAIGKLVD